MSADTRKMILDAARATAQAHGYNGLSFRQLGHQVGIKSASIHYHFPTKGDLGAELARMYREEAHADLETIRAESSDATICLKRYVALFRRALENANRMCLCSFMAAEYDDLPVAVKEHVVAFADLNVDWIAAALVDADASAERDPQLWAMAIHAAISGAQLSARSRNDISMFDRIIEAYRESGLIP